MDGKTKRSAKEACVYDVPPAQLFLYYTLHEIWILFITIVLLHGIPQLAALQYGRFFRTTRELSSGDSM